VVDDAWLRRRDQRPGLTAASSRASRCVCAVSAAG